MASVTFKGNIGKVRELAFNNDGTPRFGFSVGEGHGRFDKQTNQFTETGTTWWNVTVFGREAEALAETIQEGAKQRVVVQGRSSTREYESGGETRTSLDVVADMVGVIPKAQQSGGQAPQQQQRQDPWSAPQQAPAFGDGGNTGPPPF